MRQTRERLEEVIETFIGLLYLDFFYDLSLIFLTSFFVIPCTFLFYYYSNKCYGQIHLKVTQGRLKKEGVR